MCNHPYTYHKFLVVGILLFISDLFISFTQIPGYSIKDFSALHSLAGVWKMNKGASALYEVWERKNDTLLIGKSYKITSKDTMIFENVRLFLQKSAIIYAPIAKGQNDEKEVVFGLRQKKNQKFTFENKEHDFPQRIVYHLVSADSLHAWVEGEINGKTKKTEFYYTRVK